MVLRNLRHLLFEKNITTFSTYGTPFAEFNNYRFINAHFGITPIDNPNFDTAVLLRDPFDRVISNFAWFMMNNTFDYRGSYENLSVEQKLKRYLFEDSFYFCHRNVQVRFLTGKVSDKNMDIHYRLKYNPDDPIYFEKPVTNQYEHNLMVRSENWFLESENFTLEEAKTNLDKCLIVGTTDNHSKFMDNIFSWFKENWDYDLQEDFNKLIDEKLTESGLPYYNYSIFTDSEGNTYTTKDLKSMLTQEEIAQVYKNNSLDLELYNYAKGKL